MPRPTIATPADVRSAALALLAEAGVGESPSAQSFRRAVSVRRVRERLGGGNPATIGRAINALEAELVRSGVAQAALPELPPDIAELMQRLWRAAVGVQLDDLVRLRQEAQAVADGAREQLTETQLRVEMLKQELGELRAGLTDRDARLAQATADQAAQADRAASLQRQLDAVLARETAQRAENEELRAAHAAALAVTQERYEGLSRRLLEETAQQRQAAQAELARLASQLKFADKRHEALEARLQHAQAELAGALGLQQQAAGEVAALRYVNTSLRAQIDEFVRALPAASAVPAPGLARGRKRPPKASGSGKAPKTAPKTPGKAA
jgi:ABC-type transporter Mla subunit MlaD